jgi:hypothetical protein
MLARLERATYCLEGNCSIQLSYSTTVKEVPQVAKSGGLGKGT